MNNKFWVFEISDFFFYTESQIKQTAFYLKTSKYKTNMGPNLLSFVFAIWDWGDCPL